LCRELAARDGSSPSISGLIRHRGSLRGALDPSLAFTGDRSITTSNLQYQRHKLERRLFLGTLARRTGARVLHLPDPPGTPLDMRVPRIVTCHDLIPLVLARDYLAPLPGARALQWARDFARYRTARRVIAISAATKRDLIEHLSIAPERVDVIHLGVDHDRFNPSEMPDERRQLSERLGLTAPYLLYLGAGDVRKNLPLLIRAFARSRAAADLTLLLAGPISARQRARLQRTAEQSGVEQRVRLLGYVEEPLLAALYRQCHAHVFPSSYEGFGLPILEAMACGAPTVTSALSSLGEVAGDAALTIPELDLELLATAIRRIVDDASLRATLRERGLARARSFTWQRCATQTLECYTRILGECE
jgi:glycosyltransferase involved in cell wall biosynthesis